MALDWFRPLSLPVFNEDEDARPDLMPLWFMAPLRWIPIEYVAVSSAMSDQLAVRSVLTERPVAVSSPFNDPSMQQTDGYP